MEKMLINMEYNEFHKISNASISKRIPILFQNRKFFKEIETSADDNVKCRICKSESKIF